MIGLVVNPVAGVGGPAGLAGSDGVDVQRLAAERGARSRVQERTAAALAVLARRHPGLVIATVAGPMGADAVRRAGLVPHVVGAAVAGAGAGAVPVPEVGVLPGTGGSGADPASEGPLAEDPAADARPIRATDATDTSAAVAALAAAGVSLILAVGGDGTMRDVVAGLAARSGGGELPGTGGIGVDRPTPEHSPPWEQEQGEDAPAVLGVPAGVKMYSPVFAVSPSVAGAITADWIDGVLPVAEREVLDIDEAALRRTRVEPRLYGMLRVPFRAGRTQARKAATPATEASAVEAAARGVVARMLPGVRYLLGPGGTTAEVARLLSVIGTPLGVDVVLDGTLVRAGASEHELLKEIAAGPARAVVTVIGGQGFLLGRGNQQLSAAIIRALGDDPLLVVAPEQKLIDLHGRPLLVDTGDAQLDARLAGHIRVITGVGTSSLYAVIAPEALADSAPPTFHGLSARPL